MVFIGKHSKTSPLARANFEAAVYCAIKYSPAGSRAIGDKISGWQRRQTCLSGEIIFNIFFRFMWALDDCHCTKIYQTWFSILQPKKIAQEFILVTGRLVDDVQREQFRTNRATRLVFSCSSTGSIRHDPYWTSKEEQFRTDRTIQYK